ncbi:uncharacterized protein LOC132864430 isoform X1 [Neoarius graeffei]|uniref:uncharacterized protein LOC132864430 isoform X1 n=1 Tax=Neoarius graeffei TaxID=443677 RepID=UPI00298C45DE|nr:uncharacterized protein LOC132864430 isoform X1 [Neoarius graeffei]
MDVLVWYWSDDNEKVVVHYLDSKFLGHTQSEKLVESIKASLSPLDPNKLLQISMDGPSVNKKLLRLFEEDWTKEAPGIRGLINLGTCGLHTVHGSFQQGEKESGWKIGDKLRALWQLFHDTPARRDDFIEITKTSTFPLKFCAHRWVEDLPVADRALKIWPHVEKFIDNYKKLPKSKVPMSASYTVVREAVGDPLFEAKLQFFAYVARQLKPFLEAFQTDAPMNPFLAKDLQILLKSLISCFMKREVLENIKTPVQMLKTDVQDKALHLPLKEVDLGFATKQALEKASEKLLEKLLLGQQFRRECVAFLSATAKKLLDKCPLNYAAVRHMACLDPVTMISDQRSAISMFEKLLQLLLNANWHTAEDCDQILSEYKMFLTEIVQHHKEEFQGYRSSSCWLDTFMGRLAGGKAEYAILWKSMKDLFTLSHGQAVVERGYSVNKDMLVANLKERTLMCLCLIQDSLTDCSFDGVLPKPFLQHCRNARMRYVQYLDDEKRRKRKLKMTSREKSSALKSQKWQQRDKIITSIKAMQTEADAMAEKAERKQDFTLLTKSNAYRKSVAEKRKRSLIWMQFCQTSRNVFRGVRRATPVLFLNLGMHQMPFS